MIFPGTAKKTWAVFLEVFFFFSLFGKFAVGVGVFNEGNLF